MPRTHLKVWSYLKQGEPLQRWLETVADRFRAEYPTVELRIEYCDRSILARLDSVLAGTSSDELPDVVSQIRTWMEPFARRGLFADLSDSLDTPAFQLSMPWRDTFHVRLLESLKIRDSEPFIPQNLFIHAFHYNQELLGKLRLPPPATWSQFEHVCNTLRDSGITPIAVDGALELFSVWYFIRFAERLVGPERLSRAASGEAVFAEHPGFLAAAEYVARFSERGWFQSGFQDTEYPHSHTLFCEGRAAMLAIGGWFCAEMLDRIPAAMRIGVFPFPELPQSQSARHEEMWANVYAVLASSQHKVAAVDFLKILTSHQMDAAKAALKSPSPLVDGTPVAELVEVPVILGNATSVGDTYNGLSSVTSGWFDSVFKRLGRDLLCGCLKPEEFIHTLDRQTRSYYRG